jgi:hypothetical protein
MGPLALTLSRRAGQPNTKNVLKNRALNPPYGGDVKFIELNHTLPSTNLPVDNLAEGE